MAGAATGGDGLSFGGGSLRGRIGFCLGFGSSSEGLRSEPELPSVSGVKRISNKFKQKVLPSTTRIFESDAILTLWIW